MSEVDILQVLAEEAGTNDPISLVQRLEGRGLAVRVAEGFDPDEQSAAVLQLAQSMDPFWTQGAALRTRLINDGWSEEMAEHLASDWLHMMLAMIGSALVEGDQDA